MAETRPATYPALKETIMRYAPAALALSALFAMTASMGTGAEPTADPRAAALIAQGRAALAGGDAQAAIDAYEAALAVDPAFTPIYLDLAEAARRQDLQGKAIHYYREALEREPDNLAALSGEGAALVEKGAVEKARRNLAKVQSLCGGSCPDATRLAAAIARGPQPRVVTAEAIQPEPAVSQN